MEPSPSASSPALWPRVAIAASVTLSGATGVTPVTVPVTFTVTAAPNISLNPSSLILRSYMGAANPTNQTVSLANTGGTLNWTVSDSASWLSVSPASGSSSSTLTTAVNTSGLAGGTYNGTIHRQCDGIFIENGSRHTDGQCSNDFVRHVDMVSKHTDSNLAGYKVYRATTSGAYGAALTTVPAGTVSLSGDRALGEHDVLLCHHCLQ